MDFLLEALPEIAMGIFYRTANLLNLSCDVIFVDTFSTYFERDVPEPLAELDTASGEREANDEEASEKGPDERATRRFSSTPRTAGPTVPKYCSLRWSPPRGSRSAAGPFPARRRTRRP